MTLNTYTDHVTINGDCYDDRNISPLGVQGAGRRKADCSIFNVVAL